MELIERAKVGGRWLTAVPNALNDTLLSAEEFRDNLSLRYGYLPNYLPKKCDGCNAKFTVTHALNCKNGGLISLRHDEIADEWARLCAIALTPAAIVDRPYIFYGEGDNPDNPKHPDFTNASKPSHVAYANAQGDKGAIGFWNKGRMTVFDARIINTNSPSYADKKTQTILNDAEKRKLEKYQEPCLQRRRHFTPLIYSVDGVPGKRTAEAEQRLANLISIKLTMSYSQSIFLVRSRMSMALCRCNTMLLRTSRDKHNNPRVYRHIISDRASVSAMHIIKELYA